MSEPASKKAFGVYATVLAALLALAAGVYFQMINGTFGATRRVCYDAPVVWLLVGGAVVSVLLIVLKRYGLASAVSVAAPGCALLFFVHKCYWYVSDVFVAIDEKGFDPNFITFTALAAAAFVVGEIALYARKTKPVKA